MKDHTFFIEIYRFPWWREKEPEGGEYIIDEIDKDMGNPLRPLGTKSLDEYREEGYQYFIVNSLRYGHYFKLNSERSRNFPSFQRFYKELFNNAKLIKEFDPAVDNRPGPVIKIFRLHKLFE